MLKDTTPTAGIDTGKHTLDIAVHGKEDLFQVDNTEAGWRKLAADLAEAGVGRVGIEATGGYERGVTRYLQDQGFTVLVLQPAQVRAFARLHLCRAKTDRIDAAMIAACTHLLEPQARKPDPRLDKLRAADLHRAARGEHCLLEDPAGAHPRRPPARPHRGRHQAAAGAPRRRAQGPAQGRAGASRPRPASQAGAERARDRPADRPRPDRAHARTRHISREQAAALAGLAPFVQQSGSWTGQAHIAGGRKRLRRSLYAAALAAAFRWNPALNALYLRLTKRGKPHTLALVACARKLLVFANAVLARGTPWTEKPADA